MRGDEIRVSGLYRETLDHNLVGDSSKDTLTALYGLTPGVTDINAASDGAAPTALTDILDTTLSNNGGSTGTHALLIDSPAIDMGDPAATPGGGDVPKYDQRGWPYTRQSNGRIDIGALELQSPSPPHADFDESNRVDGSDFLYWQRGYGIVSPNALKGDGDADDDKDVDGDDLGIWENTFGDGAALAPARSASDSSSMPGVAYVMAAAAPSRRPYIPPLGRDVLDLAYAGVPRDVSVEPLIEALHTSVLAGQPVDALNEAGSLNSLQRVMDEALSNLATESLVIWPARSLFLV